LASLENVASVNIAVSGLAREKSANSANVAFSKWADYLKSAS